MGRTLGKHLWWSGRGVAEIWGVGGEDVETEIVDNSLGSFVVRKSREITS